ncbi:carbonic anhydrase 9 [Grus japonensis]|uniref:Carbonic anhydrase 9 n=1 Tax=Grus japonensis TaxID=30415 RepID=A0ABC9YHE4_GRUJA
MGTMQSPINIDTARTIFSPQLQRIQLSGYSLPANEKLKLRNSGHTSKEVLVPGFSIAGLLPANLKLYFHYNGSLTTPSCYQMVKWTVFNQTMLFSHDQMSMLVTSLRKDDSKPLKNNFWLVQDLHGQQVLASFQITLLLMKHLPFGYRVSKKKAQIAKDRVRYLGFEIMRGTEETECRVKGGNLQNCCTNIKETTERIPGYGWMVSVVDS